MNRLLLFFATVASLSAQSTIATFNTNEFLGTNWPTQPIEMRDLAYPGRNAKMIGPDGMTEIPWQWISPATCFDHSAKLGCALIFDSLSSFSSNTYTLTTGTPTATPAHPVTVTKGMCPTGVVGWIISNGLGGVCALPTQGTSTTHYAPIQGILLANGTWSGGLSSTPNIWYRDPVIVSAGLNIEEAKSVTQSGKQTPANVGCCGTNGLFNGATGSFIEQGPLKTVYQIQYAVKHPIYTKGTSTSTVSSACTSGSCNLVTVSAGVLATPAVMFVGATLPATLSNGVVYYLRNCVQTTTNASPVNCNLSTTPTGSLLTWTTSFSGNTQLINAAAGSTTVTFRMTVYAKTGAVDVWFSAGAFNGQYFLDFYPGLQADTVRWRGDGSTAPSCGYEDPIVITNITAPGTGGSVITGANSRGTIDAQNGNTMLVQGTGTSLDGQTLAMCSINTGTNTFQLQTINCSGAVQTANMTSTTGIGKPMYQSLNSRADRDAFFDLPTSFNSYPSHDCDATNHFNSALGVTYSPNWPTGGWYTWAYKSGSGSSAPIIGMAEGAQSQVINVASGNLGPQYGVVITEHGQPGWFTGNNTHWLYGSQTNSFGVEHAFYPAEVGPTVQGDYIIYTDTIGNQVNPNTLEQPIQDAQNALSGINISSITSYATVYPDPVHFPSMSSANFSSWKSYLQSNSTYWSQLKTSVGAQMYGAQASKIYDMLHYENVATGWNSGTQICSGGPGTGCNAEQAAYTSVIGLGFSTFGQVLAFQSNKYSHAYQHYNYFQNLYSPAYPMCAAILQSPYLITTGTGTNNQKAYCKALLAIGGAMINDANFWSTVGGDNGGLQNQQVLFVSYQNQSIATIPTNPTLAPLFSSAVANARAGFSAGFNQYGACNGSPHYCGNYTQGGIQAWQALNNTGFLPYDPNIYPWGKVVQWLASTLTPPEPRFANIRMAVELGDGNTESGPRAYAASIGTQISASDPINSALGLWVWDNNNPTSCSNTLNCLTQDGSTSGYSNWLINPALPSTAPTLTTQHFPGYYTNFRYGFGGTTETSCWFINGDFYSLQGHRHVDQGQLSCNPLSIPMMVDMDSNLETPRIDTARCHNKIQFDSDLGGLTSWSDSNPADFSCNSHSGSSPLPSGSNQQPTSTVTHFSAFTLASRSVGSYDYNDDPSTPTIWTRDVRIMAPDLSFPHIYVRDTFAGVMASQGKTLSWITLSTTASHSIMTPTGSYTPSQAFSYSGSPANPCQNSGWPAWPGGTVSPSSGGLTTGLNEWQYNGPTWAHATNGGADWNIYERPTGSTMQFLIENWGTACTDTVDAQLFMDANSASHFQENSDALRLHQSDNTPYETTITPYYIGATAPTVSYASNYSSSFGTGESLAWDAAGSSTTYTDGTKTALIVWDSSTQTYAGMSLTGGAQELVNSGTGTLTWTVGDIPSSLRCATLPSGTWYPSAAVQIVSGQTCLYQGGTATLQVQPVMNTVTFSATPTTIHTVQYSFTAPAGATQISLAFGTAGQYNSNVACAAGSTCTIMLQAPGGTYAVQHEFLDNAGNVIGQPSPVETVTL